MKDEELADKHAEEYVMRKDIITENDRVPFDNGYGFQTVSFEDEVKKGYKDGFLAGLKAGRPQWHDLRKAPNDLPEKMGLGSKEVYVAYENGVTDFACYRFDKKCWERSENEELAENVVAWCEIPTFDKE